MIKLYKSNNIVIRFESEVIVWASKDNSDEVIWIIIKLISLQASVNCKTEGSIFPQSSSKQFREQCTILGISGK